MFFIRRRERAKNEERERCTEWRKMRKTYFWEKWNRMFHETENCRSKHLGFWERTEKHKEGERKRGLGESREKRRDKEREREGESERERERERGIKWETEERALRLKLTTSCHNSHLPLGNKTNSGWKCRFNVPFCQIMQWTVEGALRIPDRLERSD